MFMRAINHVITDPETRLRVENRAMSKLNSFPYTCGIIIFCWNML